MSGITPKTFQTVRKVLLDCGPIGSDPELRSVFADPRLRPWRNRLPQAYAPTGRVDAVIDFLHNKANVKDENALVLFLHVLSEKVETDAEGAVKCSLRLAQTAAALAQETGSPLPAGAREKPVSVKSAIARLFTASGQVVGAGFLVTDRHVLTCAHVVRAALGLPKTPAGMPGDAVQLDLPFPAPGKKHTTRPVFWDAEADVAGLVLAETDNLPAEAGPAYLAPAGGDSLWDHPFRAFGFPAGYDDGVWAAGLLRDVQAKGWLQIEDTNSTGYAVQPGFSGGPVWDDQLQQVVGMVTLADTTKGARAAYAIPAKELRTLWSDVLGNTEDNPPSRPGSSPTQTTGPAVFTGPVTFHQQGDSFMGDKIDMSGDFRGAIVNVKSRLNNVTQTIGTLPHADEETKDELKQLLAQLEETLEQTPPERAPQAEEVSRRVESLVEEASEEEPSEAIVEVEGNRLKKAAENLKDALPAILTIATQIVAQVAKTVR